MGPPLSPPPQYPLAAYRSIDRLIARIAALERRSSETRALQLRHPAIPVHPATRRLLDELEFLHASHARALAGHAGNLPQWHEDPPAGVEAGHALPEETLSESGQSDFEEILIVTYGQLNALAALYTRLHTLALAFDRPATAELSLAHLKAVTPQIMVCSQALPLVTADEAIRHFGHVNPGCAETALEATQAAWKNETQFPAST